MNRTVLMRIFVPSKFQNLPLPHQEEEEDGNNHDEEEEQSKRSELSDKVMVTAVVELEPIAALEEEPQGKAEAKSNSRSQTPIEGR